VIYGKAMYLYGGSTGMAMNDFHALTFDFRRVWAPVQLNVCTSRATVTTGTAGEPLTTHSELDDAHSTSANVPTVPLSPGPRFCHVGVVYENAFYIFGGYDGSNRLNDFLKFTFDEDFYHSLQGGSALLAPTSTIVSCDDHVCLVVECVLIYLVSLSFHTFINSINLILAVDLTCCYFFIKS
jgi:hypothetical protein